jgi:signal peptidase
MIPNINVSDLIITRQQSSYKIGDVIAFTDGNHITTHRIVEQNANSFTTRGDANNTNDTDPVHKDLIHGKVILVIPGVGKILNYLHSPMGMISVCSIGLLLIFIEPVIDYLTNKKGVTYDKKA